jgi:hypothetical protein
MGNISGEKMEAKGILLRFLRKSSQAPQEFSGQ